MLHRLLLLNARKKSYPMSVRFAILGAGRIGQVHARAVDSNDEAVLAVVFDPVEAAAASVAEQYGAEIRDLDAIAAAERHRRRYHLHPDRLACAADRKIHAHR